MLFPFYSFFLIHINNILALAAIDAEGLASGMLRTAFARACRHCAFRAQPERIAQIGEMHASKMEKGIFIRCLNPI